MLAREDEASHSAVLRRRDDLVRIEIGRVEDSGRFVARAARAVGEGVHGEREEAVERECGRGELRGAGDRGVGNGWIDETAQPQAGERRARGEELPPVYHRTDR